MSGCPFWSTRKEKFECYDECPMVTKELLKGQDSSEQCIFNVCMETINIKFKDIINEDYIFSKLSIYDDEVSINY